MMRNLDDDASPQPAALASDGVSLSLENYFQFFIGSISNRLLRSSTKDYNAMFGITLNEWRTMAILAIEDGITATRICEVIGFDKASVSRSLRGLEERGLITSKGVDSHNRRRELFLTASGHDLHTKVMHVALRREEALLKGLTENQRSDLIEMMRILHQNAIRIELES